jgi:hypothetical protein
MSSGCAAASWHSKNALTAPENMRGVIVPKTLTAELERTRRWAREIFTGYGFDLPDSAAASPDVNGD